MSRKTRFLSALLAALLLAGSLTACATGADDPADTKAPSDTTASSESDDQLKDNLPGDLDFNDDEINIIARDRLGWTDREIAVDKLNGDPINDAVYERNKLVEDRLHVRINHIPDDDWSSYELLGRVENAVNAGTNDYDIISAACYVTLGQSPKGLFANLRDSAYIDFDQPWWSRGLNDATLYKGHQHVLAGAMLLSIYRFAYVTVFNQKLFTDAGQNYLYEYVDNGTWTLDKQISLVPVFHRDNGNNVQDTEGDIYGFISTQHISVDPYWSSCEVDILSRDEDGNFVMVFNSGKLFDVADKVLKLYYETDDSSYIFSTSAYDGHMDNAADMFSEGKGAMATVRIMGLERESVRSMTDKFGIVPMPKFDENQKEYHSMLHDQFSVISVPTTVQGDRLDEVGAVLEALSSTAYRVVKPVYYEETLRTKIAQDPQSSAMLELIVDNLTTDSGIFYTDALGGFQNAFRDIIGSKQNTVTSTYKASVKVTAKKLKNLMLNLDRLADEE
jgi:ABC-type glycerol-3-phosphate transport system substrate-binding protein